MTLDFFEQIIRSKVDGKKELVRIGCLKLASRLSRGISRADNFRKRRLKSYARLSEASSREVRNGCEK